MPKRLKCRLVVDFTATSIKSAIHSSVISADIVNYDIFRLFFNKKASFKNAFVEIYKGNKKLSICVNEDSIMGDKYK